MNLEIIVNAADEVMIVDADTFDYCTLDSGNAPFVYINMEVFLQHFEYALEPWTNDKMRGPILRNLRESFKKKGIILE